MSSWTTAALALGLAAAFLVLTRWPPAPTFDFVVWEPGQNLFLADRILAGQMLYRDVFSQYGPLPIYAHALAAAVFGNSPATFQGFVMAGDLAAFALAGRLLLRWLRPVAALAWLALGLGGKLLRGNYPNVYPPFEAIFFLSALLCWRPPGRRGAMRSLAMGIFVGLMQTAKFGSAFFAGFALLLADAWQWQSEGGRPAWSAWLRSLAWTATGAFLAEGVLAAWLFAGLPAADAWDVLWPSYLRVSYASYVAPEIRFFHWHDAGLFAGVQAPVLVGAGAASLLALALAWRRARFALLGNLGTADAARAAHGRAYAGLAIGLGAFFPVALALYLPHYWVAIHYVWIPALAAAGCFALFRPWARMLLVLSLAASAWATTLSPMIRGRRPILGEDKAFANGQQLRVRPEDAALFEAVAARPIRADGAPPAWLIFPAAFGWEHFGGGRFRVGAPGLRHWWFMPGILRPRDQAALVRALDQVDAVLVDVRRQPVARITPDPSTWGQASPGWPRDTNATVAARLGPPEEVQPNVWCFPVRRGEATPPAPARADDPPPAG